jgi:excisionase family DNA binding protein
MNSNIKGMEKLLRQRLQELDDLQAGSRHQDNPVETLDFLLTDTVEQAAQMGSEIYKTAPDRDRLTVNDLRWWLTSSLEAITGKPKDVLTGQPLTVPEVAKLLRVRPDKVLSWIRSGRLRGYNITERENGRPKYRINQSDLDVFAQQRAITQPAPKGRPAGRRRIPSVPAELPTL